MTDQHFEVDVLIREAEGNQSEAHGEYTTADSDTGMVAKEVTEALKSRLGSKYRPINPDA
jgi:hypothetical protein